MKINLNKVIHLWNRLDKNLLVNIKINNKTNNNYNLKNIN